jgi:glycosyltransferase involved in cell wall biosynthesis
MKLFALTNGDVSCASTLYRLLQFRPLMERGGVAFEYARAADFKDFERLREADVVVIQKFLLPPDRVESIRAHSRRLVYDIDDTIWHSPGSQPHGWLTRQGKLQQLRSVARVADLCIAANHVIARDLEEAGAGHIRVLPMALNPAEWHRRERTDEALVIGWTGSPGNLRYLRAILPDLLEIQSRWPEVRFRFHSGQYPELPGLEFDYLPFIQAGEPLAVSQFDIGLLPLPEEPFARGKSPIKTLQYFSCGVAVTGIPVGATGEIMVDEVNSLYVDAGRDWITAVGALIEKEILRKEIATTGLAQFTHHHTTDHLWPRLLELLTG